jgi:hypothetical protein
MAVIECRNPCDPQAFRDRNNRCVSRAEREVAVLNDQISHARIVSGHKWLGPKLFSCQRAEERRLRLRAELGEHVADFGDNDRRDD